MHALPSDLYARWRDTRPRSATLQEPVAAPRPSEQVLQQIWRHQRLRRDGLRTDADQALQVLHPGFWNREPGPDFRNALLQFNSDPPVTGDVEVDLDPAGWTQHRHAQNPAYATVRLHVVWEPGSRPGLTPPTLALRDLLDAPLEELERWLADDAPRIALSGVRGLCAEPLGRLPADALADLLGQAGRIRLGWKALRIQARARQAGWSAALQEALLMALGYKHNRWPMRRVAELLPSLCADQPDVPTLQARLLGVANLLPRDVTRRRPASDAWLRRTWDVWWRDQSAFADLVLPRSAWRLAGVRPANHPQRRLALAAHWFRRDRLDAGLDEWLVSELSSSRLVSSLRDLLQPEPDSFWTFHWTLNSPRLAHRTALLGNARVTDLALNAILPWLHARAAVGQVATLLPRVEARFAAWPAAQDNADLRLARDRLLGGAGLPQPCRATHQQGLLQVLHDFCHHSNARCDGCRFPALLANL